MGTNKSLKSFIIYFLTYSSLVSISYNFSYIVLVISIYSKSNSSAIFSIYSKFSNLLSLINLSMIFIYISSILIKTKSLAE